MKSPLPKNAYQKNAEIYKILANPIRLEILNILKKGESSVEKLTKIIGIRKPNVSQHLALLRHVRLVSVSRNGQEIYYKIINPKIVEPCKILHDLRQKNLL